MYYYYHYQYNYYYSNYFYTITIVISVNGVIVINRNLITVPLKFTLHFSTVSDVNICCRDYVVTLVHRLQTWSSAFPCESLQG